MKNYLILSTKSFINAYRNEPDLVFIESLKAMLKESNSALVNFFINNNLIIDSEKWLKFDDWDNFEIYKNDVTEECWQLVKLCLVKWEKSLDRKKKNFGEMRIWSNGLEKIRASNPATSSSDRLLP